MASHGVSSGPHSVWGGRPLSNIRILSGTARVAVAMLIAAGVLLAAAPAHAAKAKPKKLTRYAASGEVCKPVKPLTEETQPSSGSVSGALPAPPAGQKWRLTFGVNTNGFTVRVFLGDDQVGSGLIRWDRSYRFLLSLDDFDVAGSTVDVSGRIEGCNISAPDPVTKITAAITGPLQLADDIELMNGDLVWDADGMRLNGDARILCASAGALRGTATVEYRTADSWTLHLLGSSEGTCIMEEELAIGGATIGGQVDSSGGTVDGRFTGRANVSAPSLPFGPWAATFTLTMTGPAKAMLLNFDADAESEAGWANVTIGPDGQLVISLNLKGGTTDEGEEVPSTEDAYVDPASLLPDLPTGTTAVRCRVPRLARGMTLTGARRTLRRANCGIRIKRVRSKKVRKGRVVGTPAKRGARLSAGRKVTVLVSGGPGPKRRATRRG